MLEPKRKLGHVAVELQVSHTWIRKAVQIARLPHEVIAAFSDPTAIQPGHADDISAALTADQAGVMRRATELGASKRSIKRSATKVVDRLVARSAPIEVKFLLRCGSRTVGTWRRDGKGRAVVTLDADVSDDEAFSVFLQALVQRAGEARIGCAAALAPTLWNGLANVDRRLGIVALIQCGKSPVGCIHPLVVERVDAGAIKALQTMQLSRLASQ